MSRCFIQFAEIWGPPDKDVNFREGFRQYVSQHADPRTDAVHIIEPNEVRAEHLRSYWTDWQKARIEIAYLVARPPSESMDETRAVYYWSEADAPTFETFAPVVDAVRWRFPSTPIHTSRVPIRPVADLLLTAAGERSLALLSIDLRQVESDILSAIPWHSLQCEAVGLVIAGVPRSHVERTEALLRSVGFRRAGRAWGEAGATRLFKRPSSTRVLAAMIAAEGQALAGAGVVRVRDAWLGPHRRHVARSRAQVLLRRKLRTSDVLDWTFGAALSAVPRLDPRGLLPNGSDVSRPAWKVDLASEPDPMVVARECHETHGVWPISFSYPREPMPLNPTPAELVAPIIPGYPYTFTDERNYLETYRQAYLGVTHRKAGWDCFRHVEILASGALPLMIDADEIPGFAMVHYPKRAMGVVSTLAQATGAPPDESTRQQFRDYFARHLTSAAMARYLLRASDLNDEARILFIDESLQGHADYLSSLTLIGLKQVLGVNCHVMFPIDYVYANSTVYTEALYGRGFGYTRVVPTTTRSSTELDGQIDYSSFDGIIVGSVTRNDALAQQLLARAPADRMIWIHGEDLPPTPSEVQRYRSSVAHVFVRAIHVPQADLVSGSFALGSGER